jgi:hypothetical protein
VGATRTLLTPNGWTFHDYKRCEDCADNGLACKASSSVCYPTYVGWWPLPLSAGKREPLSDQACVSAPYCFAALPSDAALTLRILPKRQT